LCVEAVVFYALGAAFLILMLFILVGQSLLAALHVPMASFQMAGSLVLPQFGAILTVVLLTDNKVRSFAEQLTTMGILALCLALFFALYAAAGWTFRLLGKPGVEIVSRVFGLILASIAVTGLIVAIKLSFGLD